MEHLISRILSDDVDEETEDVLLNQIGSLGRADLLAKARIIGKDIRKGIRRIREVHRDDRVLEWEVTTDSAVATKRQNYTLDSISNLAHQRQKSSSPGFERSTSATRRSRQPRILTSSY